jgi:hypothetical protein
LPDNYGYFAYLNSLDPNIFYKILLKKINERLLQLVYYSFTNMTKQRSRKRSTRKKLRATSNGNADPDMMSLATQMGDDLMKKIDDEYLEKFGADDEYSLQDIHEYRRKDLYKYDVEYLREMVKYMHTLFELRKKQIEEFKAKAKETSETE